VTGDITAVVLDIETANLDMDAEGLSFGNPDGWVVSCVGVHLMGTGQDYVYVRDYGPVMAQVLPTEPSYRVFPLAMLAMHMNGWLMRSIPLITHNGEGFDLPILAKSLPDGGAGCAKAVSGYADSGLHIDTCARLLSHTGLRIHLSDLCSTLLGSDPSDGKLMPAAEAPIAWSQGRYRQVIDYCIQDCVLTGRVWAAARSSEPFEVVGHKPGQKRKHRVSTEGMSWEPSGSTESK
jgi:hypothetical protein